MHVKTAKKSFLSLESAAMTDIVLNLFIFFFISFSLLYTFNPNRESKIEVKLPEGGSARDAKSEKPFTVSVDARNAIFIERQRVPPVDLKKQLSERYHAGNYSSLVVRADKSAAVEFLVKVLNTAKEIGIQKLGVAIEPAA